MLKEKKHNIIFFAYQNISYSVPQIVLLISTLQREFCHSKFTVIDPPPPVGVAFRKLSNLSIKRITLGLLFKKFLDIFDKFHGRDLPKQLLFFQEFLCCLYFVVKSYFSSCLIIVTRPSFLYCLFSKKTTVIQYQLELWDFARCYNFKNRVFGKFYNLYRKKTNYLLCPQKQRLDYVSHSFDGAKKYLVHNAPPLGNAVRKCINNKKILYQGQISKYSSANEIFSFARNLDTDIEFHIAGNIAKEYRVELEKVLKEHNNIHYHGILNFQELDQLRRSCNIGLLTWMNISLNSRLACPNKLYEYLSNGLLIVSFQNESIEIMNHEYKFGDVSSGGGESLAKIINSYSIGHVESYRLKNYQTYMDTLNFDIQIAPFIGSLRKRMIELL